MNNPELLTFCTWAIIVYCLCPDNVVAAFDLLLQCLVLVAHKFQSQKMLSAIVNEIQPINYQKQHRALTEVGTKISSEVWFGPGLNNNFMMSSHGRKVYC